MAQKNVIALTIKVDEAGEGFSQLTKNAEEFKAIVQAVTEDTGQLHTKLVDFAAICVKFDSISKSCQALKNSLSGLQQVYAAQAEVETQLAVTMRNTMAAREEDIESIKELCAAQQSLGVIGDEVQLAGAQEMATYLGKKSSLEQLIPVMNDMLAQQYGINATQENAVQIATMLGKVMEGQTGALSRYGYSFDEAQEKILKYGDESERAAVLCDVVTSSVGGMNEALAQTDIGRQKQLENTMGDLQEQIGKFAQKALPFVTMAAQTMTAVGGIVKLTQSMRTAATVVSGWHLKQKLLTASKALDTIATKGATAATRIFTSASKSATISVNVLKVAIKGLMCATVVGAAFVALTTVIEALTGATEDAADATQDLVDVEERAREEAEELTRVKEAAHTVDSEVEKNAQKEIKLIKQYLDIASDETKSRKVRLEAVDTLQRAYPSVFGYMEQEAILAGNTAEAYENLASSILKTARVRAGADKIVALEDEEYSLDKNIEAKAGVLHSKQKVTDARHKKLIEAVDAYYESINPTRFEALYGSSASNLGRDQIREMLLKEIKDDTNRSKRGGDQSLRQAVRDNWTSYRAAWDDEMDATRDLNLENAKKREVSAAKNEIREQYGVTDDIYTSSLNNETVEQPLIRLLQNLEPRPDTTPSREPVYREGATTLSEIEENVKYYQKRLEEATIETSADINANIEKWRSLANAIRESGKDVEDNKRIWHENAVTISEMQQNLATLDNDLKNAKSDEEIISINKQREALQKLISEKKELGLTDVSEPEKTADPVLNAQANTLAQIEGNIDYYQKQLQNATAAEAIEINKSIAAWEKKADAIREAGTVERGTFESIRSGWSGVKGVYGGIESATKAVKEHKDAWSVVSGVIDGALSVYDGLQQVIMLMSALIPVTKAKTEAEREGAAASTESAIAETVKATAGTVAAVSDETAGAAATTKASEEMADATATMTAAAANIFKAHSWLPWVGVALGAAGVAMMIATLTGMPKFAEGGIVSGPTVGLMGEYSGAANNPEVIAPLDKLRAMLDDDGESAIGKVEFEVRGDRLYGVLEQHKKRLARR